MLNENSTKLFEPYTLKIKINDKAIENICHDNIPIKLLIIGMCREGKKFNQLNLFMDLIKERKVEFSYCGWSPPHSIEDSGLKTAIKSGLITSFICSSKRVEDKVFNRMVDKAHAIVDLKIVGDNSYVSSGNIGASVSMRKPLIAHERNYPSFNCIRFKDYNDMREILVKKERLIENLRFQRFLLQQEYEYRKLACRKLFEA